MHPDPADAVSRSPSLTDALREGIIRGVFVPNQRLIESDLTAQYRVSRSAVRDALSELAVEGLVQRVQNRGARVRAVSIDEAVEIIEVRSAVEALCARKAAESVTEAQVLELREMGHRMQDAVDAGELEHYSSLNKRLHRRIVEISGQMTASATIERLRAQSVRHQFRLAMQPGRAAVSLPEHLEIIEAIAARDPEKAVKLMENHMDSIALAISASGR
ncbi:GntR family transcriptional regulator [Arthrobacter sp. zg-Y826]|uniref:GntR family transcriptional regulator n=1 Tax=Arthrobacter jinronghuae TaxID=2964609 RepID=UPI002107AD64|nr:GntR family transcriptional regulator [Arthrobacter jinronghuae]MCQ1957410.1 GntR family transcriptional regulator [Arthrobacter jinronghuae]